MEMRTLSVFKSSLCLEEYFQGRSTARGVFQDRFGKVRKQFKVEVEGTWDGRTLTLVEDFRYDDGKSEQRTWHIEKVGETDYRGRADSVIGVAEGHVAGNALNWRYTFALQVGGRTITTRFDDWMFQLNDTVLVNYTDVSKFGIRLGRVVLVFQKRTGDRVEDTLIDPALGA